MKKSSPLIVIWGVIRLSKLDHGLVNSEKRTNFFEYPGMSFESHPEITDLTISEISLYK